MNRMIGNGPCRAPRRGAMMLAVMLVVILIGFTLISAWPSKPTKAKRQREHEMVFKLKELRKALRTAILAESKMPNEERVITALIYGPDKISYKFDRNDTEGVALARQQKLFDYLAGKYGTAEITIGARSSPEEIENVLIRELRERRYLRTDYQVPLLDGSIIDTKQGGLVKDVRVAWRVAENLLTSSSFEEGHVESPITMEMLQDFDNYRQYWFSKSGDYDTMHATTAMEPPPFDDFDGEKTLTWRNLAEEDNEASRQTKVTPGKYGGRVLILRNP